MKSKNIFSSYDKANAEKLINRRVALLTIAQVALIYLVFHWFSFCHTGFSTETLSDYILMVIHLCFLCCAVS